MAPAPRSAEAKREECTNKTIEGFPVHCFRTLLADLGAIVKNRVIPTGLPEVPGFGQVTVPTQFQARDFRLDDEKNLRCYLQAI